MGRKTINVCENVDVDIDIDVDITEYTKDFLEACSDDEVMAEAYSRGLVTGKNLRLAPCRLMTSDVGCAIF